MAKVTTDMLISDIISIDKGVVPILMEAGMNCLGCPMAQQESLQEACSAHGQDADAIVEKINDFLSNS